MFGGYPQHAGAYASVMQASGGKRRRRPVLLGALVLAIVLGAGAIAMALASGSARPALRPARLQRAEATVAGCAIKETVAGITVTLYGSSGRRCGRLRVEALALAQGLAGGVSLVPGAREPSLCGVAKRSQSVEVRARGHRVSGARACSLLAAGELQELEAPAPAARRRRAHELALAERTGTRSSRHGSRGAREGSAQGRATGPSAVARRRAASERRRAAARRERQTRSGKRRERGAQSSEQAELAGEEATQRAQLQAEERSEDARVE